MKKIAVLMGGISSERDISLSSGKAVSKALRYIGYEVVDIIVDTKSLDLSNNKFDLAFIALHGAFGEDGKVQNLLDKYKIRYVGSSAKSCQISFNKIKTRDCLSKNGILVPPGEIIEKYENVSLSFPIIIKPPMEGSSVGCFLIKNKQELENAFNITASISSEVLVEKYIPGRELTVGIVAGTALPVVEVIPDGDWYDYRAKYTSSSTKYIAPANLDNNVSKKLQDIAIKVFNILGASGFGRVDFRLSADNKAYVLELNSIPGFTENSLLPKAAEAAGISFIDLCDLIIKDALSA